MAFMVPFKFQTNFKANNNGLILQKNYYIVTKVTKMCNQRMEISITNKHFFYFNDIGWVILILFQLN